jgi:catechol 2,3-dioxygenase-like lactoylglutathione lyase family enzyme
VRADKLDHVAVFVTDPDAVAARILSQLPFRIIEETDEFVLVGRDPMLGKLTLFAADGPREPGLLKSIGIGIPCGTVERPLDVGEGLELVLVPSDPDGEVDLDHVVLATPDPIASARAWLQFGFEPAPKGANGFPRVQLGEHCVEFRAGSPRQTDRPLLNHLGLQVESADDARRTARAQHVHVTKEVDAENSRAVFVRGPDGVELEYVEHKPSFAYA